MSRAFLVFAVLAAVTLLQETQPEAPAEKPREETAEKPMEEVAEKPREEAAEKKPEAFTEAELPPEEPAENIPSSIFNQPQIIPQLQQKPDESDAYMQVLQSMLRIEGTKDKLPNLNGAIQKLLQLNNEYSNSFKGRMKSNSDTINSITMEFSKKLFDGDYSQLAPEYTLRPPYQGRGEVTVTYSDNKTPKTTTKYREERLTGLRLLSILRMYNEHVHFKDSDVVAGPESYGHVKHFSEHLDCLSSPKCDFSRHLDKIAKFDDEEQAKRGEQCKEKHRITVPVEPKPNLWCRFMAWLGRPCKFDIPAFITGSAYSTSAHKLSEQEAASNTAVDSTPGFDELVEDLKKRLEESASNEDIKRATGQFIENAHQWLNSAEGDFPAANNQFQESLSQFKADLPKYQQIQTGQLKDLLKDWQKEVIRSINTNFNAQTITQNQQALYDTLNGIESLQQAVNKYVPIKSDIHANLHDLLSTLTSHINSVLAMRGATPEQVAEAKQQLLNEVNMQFNGVDLPKGAARVREGAANLREILDGSFGQSLTPDNLNFIVHKAILAFHNDLNGLQDPAKASNFVFDKEDLEKLTNTVLDQIKKSREAGQKALMDLKEEAATVKEINGRLQTQTNSENPAKNAANLLINYENALYNALSEDEFYNRLKDYIRRYNEIYLAHSTPLKPFQVYSNAFETLTTDLENPSLTINPAASRLLAEAVKSQAKNAEDLSHSDRRFFDFFNRLLAEWASTGTTKSFAEKLDSITRGLQGKSITSTLEVPQSTESHKLLFDYNTIKNSIIGIGTNLNQSFEAAVHLSGTLQKGVSFAESLQTVVRDPLQAFAQTQPVSSSGFLARIKNFFFPPAETNSANHLFFDMFAEKGKSFMGSFMDKLQPKSEAKAKEQPKVQPKEQPKEQPREQPKEEKAKFDLPKIAENVEATKTIFDTFKDLMPESSKPAEQPASGSQPAKVELPAHSDSIFSKLSALIKRNLAEGGQFSETLQSVRNIYEQVLDAHRTSELLKENLQAGLGIYQKVEKAYDVVKGIFG